MKPMHLINPQEAEAKVAARYRVILILWATMLTSLAVLLLLALISPSSGTANQTLTFTLLGISLIAVIVSPLLKQLLLRQSIEKQEPGTLLNAYVIGFALSESAAILGLLDHFATSSAYYRLTFIAATIGMLLHFPKKDHVRAASYN